LILPGLRHVRHLELGLGFTHGHTGTPLCSV
jgi:hypothetical protein